MAPTGSLAELFPTIEPAVDAGVTATYVRSAEQARERSARVRSGRLVKNAVNWQFVNGEQDWTGKIDGQSTIFLPDLPINVERVAGIIERRLTEFRNWYDVETPGGLAILDPDSIRTLLTHALNRLWAPGDQADCALDFPTVLADAIKVGVIESMIVLKITGRDDERIIYRLQSGLSDDVNALLRDNEALKPDPATYRRATGQIIERAIQRSFKLCVEVIPYEDHYPDMSGSDLYDIHEVDMHISELYGIADYDPDAIARLATKATAMEDYIKNKRSGVGNAVRDPWRVRVAEYWGDLVDPTSGKLLERNILMTTANGEMLRPPTKNPLWHGRRPFVKAPLIRTPLSTTHRAMLDNAVPVAEAHNEVFSLMVDAGISAVWGVRQYHPDMIENQDEAAKGIGPGFTAKMKKGERTDLDFLKRVDTGNPQLQDAALMLQRLGSSLQQAMIINDLQVGMLPPRQVVATEVVEASESSDTMFDVIAVRVERTVVNPALELCWLTMLQYLDDYEIPELLQVLGQQRATILSMLTKEERFVLFANNVRFNSTGLRQMAQRVRQFQKINTLIGTVFQFPALAQIWDLRFSPLRTLDELVQSIGLDPTRLERRPEDTERLNLALLTNPQGAMAGPSGAEQVPSPEASAAEAGMAMPNPEGDRGPQM